MRLSKGGISLEAILDMDHDEFTGWLKDAVDLQIAINKAMSK